MKEKESYLVRSLKVPLGERAEKLGFKLVKSLFKTDEFGLYRGEVLQAIANYILEYKYKPRRAIVLFEKARQWFLDVKLRDDNVKLASIPQELKEVASAPADMKSKDVWGNVRWEKIDEGAIFNRRSSDWYESYILMDVTLKKALCYFIVGKKKKSLEGLDIILKIDKRERAFHDAGYPNSYARLVAEFKESRLFATERDLIAFKGDVRTQIILADFYYETEQWNEAFLRYNAIRLKKPKLNKTSESYLLLMHGFECMKTKKYEESIQHFNTVKEEFRGTPSWPRAVFCLYTHYQNSKSTHKQAVVCLELISKELSGTIHDKTAVIALGVFYYSWGHSQKAQELFLKYVENNPKAVYVSSNGINLTANTVSIAT